MEQLDLDLRIADELAIVIALIVWIVKQFARRAP